MSTALTPTAAAPNQASKVTNQSPHGPSISASWSGQQGSPGFAIAAGYYHTTTITSQTTRCTAKGVGRLNAIRTLQYAGVNYSTTMMFSVTLYSQTSLLKPSSETVLIGTVSVVSAALAGSQWDGYVPLASPGKAYNSHVHQTMHKRLVCHIQHLTIIPQILIGIFRFSKHLTSFTK